jgi:hypothetical protein
VWLVKKGGAEMMQKALVLGTALTIFAFAAPAAAREKPRPAEVKEAPENEPSTTDEDETPPDGFSFGGRAGYALPMGSIAKDASLKGATDLSRAAAGMAPFWGEMGYRINPHWYIGGYFQLGIVSTAGDLCNRLAGTSSCSSSGIDLRFGAIARYTFKPTAKISPWVGASSGYEITNLSVTYGEKSEDMSANGWELIGVHFGVDFHPAPRFVLGPAVMASFGQYSSQSWSDPTQSGSSDFNKTSLHEWVFFGLRGQYDL